MPGQGGRAFLAEISGLYRAGTVCLDPPQSGPPSPASCSAWLRGVERRGPRREGCVLMKANRQFQSHNARQPMLSRHGCRSRANLVATEVRRGPKIVPQPRGSEECRLNASYREIQRGPARQIRSGRICCIVLPTSGRAAGATEAINECNSQHAATESVVLLP